MQVGQKDNLLMMRLFPGEKVVSRLEKACRQFNVKTGVIVCGIGQLHKVKLGYFKNKGNYASQSFIDAYELLSLSGLVSKNKEGGYDFHLHTVLGGEDKQTIGGHLIEGEVKITAEIVLLKTEIQAGRKINPETGLSDLTL